MRPRKQVSFNVKSFLAVFGKGRTITDYRKGHTIYSQGDPADAVFSIETGKAEVTVISTQGKEAVGGILGPRDFFDEACRAGQRQRISTAAALSECTIARLEKRAATRIIHEEPEFAELFLAYILSRSVRIEGDLVDQLFNSSEKRLARVLLLPAKFGKDGKPHKVIPQLRQEPSPRLLAQLVPGEVHSHCSTSPFNWRKL